MTVTIQLSDRTAHRLMGLCEKAVKEIGSRLALEGMKGLSSAAGEIREVAELIAKLESAGVRMRAEPREAPERTPEAPQAEPELPLTEPTSSAPAAAHDVEPGATPDEAPPAAVIAARAKPRPAHTNGAKQKWQRAGASADRDAESGP